MKNTIHALFISGVLITASEAFRLLLTHVVNKVLSMIAELGKFIKIVRTGYCVPNTSFCVQNSAKHYHQTRKQMHGHKNSHISFISLKQPNIYRGSSCMYTTDMGKYEKLKV